MFSKRKKFLAFSFAFLNPLKGKIRKMRVLHAYTVYNLSDDIL